MKDIARKHYTQIEGTLSDTNAVTLQREAAGQICLCISGNDRPAIALAQTAHSIWTIPKDKDNFIGYNNISFIERIDGLEEGFFDLLFLDEDYCAYPENVKKEGTIFVMSNGVIEKRNNEEL